MNHAAHLPAGQDIASHTHVCSHDHHDSASGIYLISPSGSVADAQQLERACARLTALGFQVQADEAALDCFERFAGTDAQRLQAIHRSLEQPHPIVMATRGGYGLGRL